MKFGEQIMNQAEKVVLVFDSLGSIGGSLVDPLAEVPLEIKIPV